MKEINPDLINNYIKHIQISPIPANRGARQYTILPKNLKNSYVNGLPHIIFISYYPDPTLLKKSMLLRSKGVAYTTLLAGCIREDVKIERYFDQFYEFLDPGELYNIVTKSEPYSWHAKIQPLYNAAIVINSGKTSRVVVDINDAEFFTLTNSDDEQITLENTILKQADYVIHKMPEEAWDILDKQYDLKCDASKILVYPCPEFTHKPKQKKTKKIPHLAYAGGVIPYEIAIARGHENHVFDDLILLTETSKFELSLFVYQNAREMPWGQHQHYIDLESNCKYFHFKKGLPYHLLTKELRKYDAGIFFDNVSISSYNPDHFKYNVATKLFTYFEAGIPIIMYEESEFMAKLVIDNGVGVTYKASDPKTILEAIEKISQNDYSSAIKKYCEKFTMENNLELLLNAYDL